MKKMKYFKFFYFSSGSLSCFIFGFHHNHLYIVRKLYFLHQQDRKQKFLNQAYLSCKYSIKLAYLLSNKNILNVYNKEENETNK